MSAARSSRILLRTRPIHFRPQPRFNSTSAPSGGLHPSITGALAGATAAVGVGYAFYHFSGTKDLVQTAQATKQYFKNTTAALKGEAPDPSQAIEWLKDTATHYAVFIPGGKAFVSSAFKDLDSIRASHGAEVDKLVKQTYDQLEKVSDEKGLSLEAAKDAWKILEKKFEEIRGLAGEAIDVVIDNHPDLKKQIGNKVEELKVMGEKYGPEAKKKVDEAWSSVTEVLKNGEGVSAANIKKIQSIITKASEGMCKFKEKAWKEGMEQAKPYLEKLPDLKKMLEKNGKDLIQRADFKKLWELLKESAEKGDPKPVQKYVEGIVKK